MDVAKATQEKKEMDLRLIPYSEKSFVITGEETRNYKEYFKKTGRFNANLKNPEDSDQKMPGWIFSNKHLATMTDIVNKIHAGQLSPPTSPAPSPRRTTKVSRARKSALKPSVPFDQPLSLEPQKVETQTVTYNVVKPEVGMTAYLTLDTTTVTTTVTQVGQSQSGAYDSAVVKPVTNKETYLLAIVSGKWQVLGVLNDHQVTFSV